MGRFSRPDRERTSRCAPRHWTHVRAGHLPAIGARSREQHCRENGGATEILAMLAWTIYLSFIGVAFLMLLPSGNARAIRTVALLTAIAGFLIGLTGVLQG